MSPRIVLSPDIISPRRRVEVLENGCKQKMITGSKVRQSDYPIEALLLDPWSPRVMSGEEISSMMKSQHLLKDDRKVVQTDFKGIAGRSASHFGRSTLDCRSK